MQRCYNINVNTALILKTNSHICAGSCAGHVLVSLAMCAQNLIWLTLTMNMADSNDGSVNISALSSALAVAIQQATGASRQQGNVNSQAFTGGLLNQQPSGSINTNNSSRQASSR